MRKSRADDHDVPTAEFHTPLHTHQLPADQDTLLLRVTSHRMPLAVTRSGRAEYHQHQLPGGSRQYYTAAAVPLHSLTHSLTHFKEKVSTFLPTSLPNSPSTFPLHCILQCLLQQWWKSHSSTLMT
jgi:hypothetical protein